MDKELRKVINGKVECGDTARCKVTKIEGIVVVRHDYLYGVPAIGIQPEGSCKGKKHDIAHMDLPQAELLEKGTVNLDGMIPKKKVNLGDKCHDTISSFEGICTGMAVWLYACTKILITPERVEKKTYEPAKGQWFDEPQTKTTKAKAMKPKSKNTGGFGQSVSGGSPCSPERKH